VTTTPTRPPLPEPLPLPVVDNHTHLDHAREGEEPDDLGVALAAAAAVNVTRAVQIGCELGSARWTVSILDANPEIVGGVALHPTEASALATGEGGSAGRLEEALAEIEELARHPRVRVIGETGLDHYWVPADHAEARAAQELSFRRHIDLAKRTGKALQIHDRDAHADILRILDEEGAPEKTVFHCFSGDAQMARHCVDRGWYLSFAGPVTFRNANPLREALIATGLDRLLVETDAPYLAPHPYRGATNSSALLPVTVRSVAAVLGVEVEAVCVAVDRHAEELYGPW
jgi:TatD DNase family protein